MSDPRRFKVGDRVTMAGYPGTVTRVCEWTVNMYEVRLASGLICVCGSDLRPVDARSTAPKPWRATMDLIGTNRESWRQAAVGCHWSYGPYTISTQSGGGQPSGYVLFVKCQQIGERWPTFEAAAIAARAHAEESTAWEQVK